MLTKDSKRWIAYDWANSVFATSIASTFFPILFRQYWAKDLKSSDVTLALGITNSSISFFLFLALPLLGYSIDQRIKEPHNFLFRTACVGGLFTAALFFVPENASLLSLILYALAFIFFALGNAQCDAMLTKLFKSPQARELDKLSSLGYLYGYLGGGVLLFLQALLLIFYKHFGFSSPLMPAKLCFLSAGLWWILFSLPLLKIENLYPHKKSPESFLKEVFSFLKSLNTKTLWFLAAFFLYIDVVYTTYKMAVDFGLSMGLSREHLIGVLLLVQFVGVPGTLFINFIAKRFGIDKALYLGLFFFGLVIAFSPFATNIYTFAGLALLIGLSQGGIQALSRSHFAHLIPHHQQGIGFGFLNVFGKLSAILGPVIVGLSAHFLGGNTYSVLTLLPMMIFGALFLKISFRVWEEG